jgi:uncharacterized protein YjbI with pentapeptide repeats
LVQVTARILRVSRTEIGAETGVVSPGVRPDLRADCANCFALCCVALRYNASTDFALTKPAGTPCVNLAGDDRCTIHADLRPSGFAGCVTYDCQGAGQKVSQVTFGGRHWRTDPTTARWMIVVFPVVRQLHEILAYLVEAADLPAAEELRPEMEGLSTEVDQLTTLPPEDLLRIDVQLLRMRAGPLLEQVSKRTRVPLPAKSYRDADLAGRSLRGADLRRHDLHNALLIAADLRDADLRDADLRGTDTRDCDLRGADLTGALFLSTAQLHGARGDAATKIPAHLDRPAHWVEPDRDGSQPRDLVNDLARLRDQHGGPR